MNLSLGQVITLVSLGKHRFGFKFGQTICSHKQGKKERRVDKLYSTERTIQKDGKIKVMNFMRVRSVGDMVAQKISMMKAMGAWKEWNLGDEDIPHGAAFQNITSTTVESFRAFFQRINMSFRLIFCIL